MWGVAVGTGMMADMPMTQNEFGGNSGQPRGGGRKARRPSGSTPYFTTVIRPVAGGASGADALECAAK